MKSRFTLKSIFPLVCILPLIFGIVGYCHFAFDTTKKPPLMHGLPLILLLTFTLLWLFFGEFRTKMIRVKIEDKFVIVKRFGGLSLGKRYLYSDLDGFKTSILKSLTSDNEYLYLMQEGKKVGKISDFYHKNYFDLKDELKTKLKDLGFESFSYFAELKEIFT